MTVSEDSLPRAVLDEFLAAHRLPKAFLATVERYYLPLARRLPGLTRRRGALLLGIGGAQGTGKSTLADFLDRATSALFGWRNAVLSIDDFYLTRAERVDLAARVHPLLRTRGVPGTHDTGMLSVVLDRLGDLGSGERLALPRFDKAQDERAAAADWPVATGPLDLVVLEGWCVGSVAQTAAELKAPVNALEREEDPDGAWRAYVNEQLEARYRPIFDRLDALVFLAAPGFDAVYRWRLEQEQKLAAIRRGAAPAIMDANGIRRFIRHYERLTRHNLATLRASADVVFELGEDHAVTASVFRAR